MESLVRSAKSSVTAKEAMFEIRKSRVSVKEIILGAIDDSTKIPNPAKKIMLSQKYQMEQLELDEKIQKLKAALSESKQSVEDARKWIEIVKQYSEPTELTAELQNNMINKIVVHEAVKYDNGFREQKIKIYYHFVGKID